uniref:Uncharacterized protein n=1 Tax=Candidatus Kentrum sp. TC TaxID=2126339 RepID=A0A450YYJ3_9GAMM|nr:MAG: hypothetical protein BECKTC1821E_GA0114239_10677 [Candidatus Kentron sp. TC]
MGPTIFAQQEMARIVATVPDASDRAVLDRYLEKAQEEREEIQEENAYLQERLLDLKNAGEDAMSALSSLSAELSEESKADDIRDKINQVITDHGEATENLVLEEDTSDEDSSENTRMKTPNEHVLKIRRNRKTGNWDVTLTPDAMRALTTCVSHTVGSDFWEGVLSTDPAKGKAGRALSEAVEAALDAP